MSNFKFAILAGLIACSSETSSNSRQVSTGPSASIPVQSPLNVEMAQQHAATYLGTLFPGGEVHGPVCMPEEVVDGLTQCSYSLHSGTEWLVGTLLCGNLGCREGEAPASVPPDLAPQMASAAPVSGVAPVVVQQSSVTDDWLFWYLLFNNGGTTHHYHHWYDSTPSTYRSAYYSPGYRPTPASVNYYHTTYSAPVATSSRRFSAPTNSSLSRPAVKTTPGTGTSTRTTKTVTTPAKVTPTVKPVSSAPVPVASPKPVTVSPKPLPVAPKPAPTTRRSTGFGTPTRSTGSTRRGK